MNIETGTRRRLFFGNIGETSARELRDLLFPYDCDAVTIVHDPGGASRGFGFASVVDGEKCVVDLDGQMINGKRWRVAEARPASGDRDARAA